MTAIQALSKRVTLCSLMAVAPRAQPFTVSTIIHEEQDNGN